MTTTATTSTAFRVGDQVEIRHPFMRDWNFVGEVEQVEDLGSLSLYAVRPNAGPYAGTLGRFPQHLLRAAPESYVVHDFAGLNALPLGVRVRDTYGEALKVRDGWRLEGKVNTSDANFLAWGFPVIVLNPEILNEPERVEEFAGFKIGDEVVVKTDAFVERGLPAGTRTRILAFKGEFIDVEFDGWPGGYFPLLANEIEHYVAPPQAGDIIANCDALDQLPNGSILRLDGEAPVRGDYIFAKLNGHFQRPGFIGNWDITARQFATEYGVTLIALPA